MGCCKDDSALGWRLQEMTFQVNSTPTAALHSYLQKTMPRGAGRVCKNKAGAGGVLFNT